MKLKIIIDKILTLFCFFVISYLFLNLFLKSFYTKIFLSILVSILATVTISLVQKKKANKLNYKNFALYASVKGNDYLLEKIKLLFPKMQFEKKNNYLISSDNTIIFCSVKFGNVSPDEIIKISNTAKEENCTKCYLIAKDLQKNASSVIFNFADNIKFIPLKIVFKCLKSNNLLDEKLSTKIGKINYSNNIFDFIFAKNNAKRFLLVATILFLTSLIVPFKTYYIFLGATNIVLALICIIRGKVCNANSKNGIFDNTKSSNDA